MNPYWQQIIISKQKYIPVGGIFMVGYIQMQISAKKLAVSTLYDGSPRIILDISLGFIQLLSAVNDSVIEGLE